jgi:glycosyltransferase 2 family protein
MRGLVFGLCLSVAAAAALFFSTDMQQVGQQLARANVLWLIPGLLVLAAQAWVRAARWAALLRPWSGMALGPGRVADAMLVGYFVNAILPGRLGEVARSVVVARRESLAFGGIAGTVVAERAADVMTLAALAAIALAVAGSQGALLFAGVAIGIAIVLGLGRRAVSFERLIPGRTPERVASAIRAFLESVAAIPRHTLATAAGLSAIAWLADGMLVLLVARSLGIDIPVAAAVAIALGGALGTAIPAAPGYLATYELGALTLGSLAGVPGELVLPVAILTHVVGVIVLAVAGVVALGRLGAAVPSLRTIGGLADARRMGDPRAS